jgi:cardiolipin synthase (CMP-forming)
MVAGAYYVDNGRSARKAGITQRNQAGSRETTELNIPNIITLGRIILVPVIIWAIASNQMEIAFAIFVVAGISDAVDGFLAKRFNMASELGALLDPLADKALLVSIYVALGIWGALPRWIVILVVSRDFMIVAAVIVSWLFDKPVEMKPLMVSKLNTAAQVALAATILASLAFGFRPMPYDAVLMGLVTIFTLVSVSLYLVEWVRHMSTIEAR